MGQSITFKVVINFSLIWNWVSAKRSYWMQFYTQLFSSHDLYPSIKCGIEVKVSILLGSFITELWFYFVQFFFISKNAELDSYFCTLIIGVLSCTSTPIKKVKISFYQLVMRDAILHLWFLWQKSMEPYSYLYIPLACSIEMITRYDKSIKNYA